MLEHNDILKISNFLKEDLQDVFATKMELKSMEDRLSSKIDVLTMAVDSFSKEINNFRAEVPAIREKLNDHDKFLELLASKVGVKLPR